MCVQEIQHFCCISCTEEEIDSIRMREFKFYLDIEKVNKDTIVAGLVFLCVPALSFATASGQRNTCEQNLINDRIETHLNSLGQVSNPRIVACVASDLESDRSASSLCNELKVDYAPTSTTNSSAVPPPLADYPPYFIWKAH